MGEDEDEEEEQDEGIDVDEDEGDQSDHNFWRELSHKIIFLNRDLLIKPLIII